MLEDFTTALLSAVGKPEGILRLEYDPSTGIDHAQKFFEDAADPGITVSEQRLAESDKTLLDLRCRLWRDGTPDLKKEEVKNVLRAMLLELATRHSFLHTTYYAERAERMENSMKGIRVVLLTSSALRKLNSTASNWARMLKAFRRISLISDEYQAMGVLKATASVSPFDHAIFYGDLAQLPDAQAQYQDDGTVQWEIGREDGGGNNENTYQAIDRYNCGSWFQTESQNVPLVETFTSSETHRLGNSIVRCLRKVFPESFQKLDSKRRGDTLFLPVLFQIPAQNYKYSESGKRLVPETIREPTMFVHALLHVAIEVVQTMCCDTSPSGTVQILVMSFYKEWLSEFEAFLRCYLASACKSLHGYCGIPFDKLLETCYSFEALIERKVLQLNSVWSLKGIDSSVAFLFVPRRSESDFGWHGRLLDLSGLRIAISRASKRFYLPKRSG